VKGALDVKKVVPDSISIFLAPPTLVELESRLRSRGTDEPNMIKKRIKIAKEELEYADQYNYVVTNKNVADTTQEILKIMERNRTVV